MSLAETFWNDVECLGMFWKFLDGCMELFAIGVRGKPPIK